MPGDSAENGETAGVSSAGSDVQELFERLQDEVRRSGSDPGVAAAERAEDDADRRAAREDAERLWPVSADRSLRLRPGVRGGAGKPVKAVLRKLMRWYVEPLAYDQRSFNAAVLRLLDDLQAQVDRLERELRELRPERR